MIKYLFLCFVNPNHVTTTTMIPLRTDTLQVPYWWPPIMG